MKGKRIVELARELIEVLAEEEIPFDVQEIICEAIMFADHELLDDIYEGLNEV